MSAPQIAPYDLGSVPSTLGPGESEPYPPRLASVTEISPSADDSIDQDEETDESPAEVDDPFAGVQEMEPEQSVPEPEPKGNTPPAPPAPPASRVTSSPEGDQDQDNHRESRWQAFLSSAFEGIFWFSVVIGLVGQIIGFAKKFGGTPTGIAGAVLIGGVFEFLMITASMRGFSAVRWNRAWHEFFPYLVVSAIAAGVAAYMNLTHWSADMAAYFGGLTIVGYISHVFSHIHPSLRARKKTKNEQAEQARLEAERQSREADQRATYEAWLRDQQERAEAEAERQRQEAAEAERRASLREQNSELIEEAEKLLRKRPKKGTKASVREARAIGVYREVTGTRGLREALTEAGYTVPVQDTVKSWWTKDVKPRLKATT